jgi:hypothetical protein
VWYGAFVDYQQELAARVRGGKASHYAVRLIDAFEEEWGGPCYFQAIELVESGSDLQHILDAERAEHERTGALAAAGPGGVGAARDVGQGARRRRRRAARGADRARRPQAAQRFLIEDATIGSGLPAQADRHGLLGARRPARAVARLPGLRGLDNYRSPEHMTRGAVPGLASDVFTCGLILHELLAGAHPYWRTTRRSTRSSCARTRRAAGAGGRDARAGTNAEVSASCTAASRRIRPHGLPRPSCARC